MESGTTASCDRSLLLDVLLQGEEQTKQLEALLGDSELCKALAQRIQAAFRTAISMATEGSQQQQLACTNNTGSGSPRSASDSPRSENSDRMFKEHERRVMSKKRKSLPKWTNQVRLGSGAGLEAPFDDGYCWRKYGQKDILGAKHPRGYYRCTHRNAQGCLATKQVQRSDEDPSVFDVTYQGTHTCVEKPRTARMQSNHSNQPPTDQDQQKQQQPQQQKHSQDQQLHLCFPNELDVKTGGAMESKEQVYPAASSFSFLNPKNHDQYPPHALDNGLMGTFSPPLVSITASDSNYFGLSPCRMSSYGGGQSDLTEIVSAATSAVNSPVVDMDFVLDDLHNFPFDASNFFP